MGGNDRLTGGTEADTFYFGVGEGHDVIMDFAQGQDGLVLLGPEGFGFNSFDTNRNGVLDNADVGVTVAEGNTVLDFSAYGALSTLTVIGDRKSTRLNSSHANISYAVFCLKKKTRL